MTNFMEINFSGIFLKNAKPAKRNLTKINLLKLQSCLDSRQQRVNVRKSYCSRGIIITGLPHASIVGLFSFNIFLNNFFLLVLNSRLRECVMIVL